MQTLENVIDKGAHICGGQNELARRLGMTSGNLSAAKAGKRPIPDDKVAALAQIVGMKTDELWLIAQDARNPFRHAIAACIAGAMCVILSVGPTDAKALSIGDSGSSAIKNRIHIVDFLRLLKACIRAVLHSPIFTSRSMIRPC